VASDIIHCFRTSSISHSRKEGQAVYEVIYDIYDEVYPATLKEKANTFEEAVKIAESLKECNYYSNIQIIEVPKGD